MDRLKLHEKALIAGDDSIAQFLSKKATSAFWKFVLLAAFKPLYPARIRTLASPPNARGRQGG